MVQIPPTSKKQETFELHLHNIQHYWMKINIKINKQIILFKWDLKKKNLNNKVNISMLTIQSYKLCRYRCECWISAEKQILFCFNDNSDLFIRNFLYRSDVAPSQLAGWK